MPHTIIHSMNKLRFEFESHSKLLRLKFAFGVIAFYLRVEPWKLSGLLLCIWWLTAYFAKRLTREICFSYNLIQPSYCIKLPIQFLLLLNFIFAQALDLITAFDCHICTLQCTKWLLAVSILLIDPISNNTIRLVNSCSRVSIILFMRSTDVHSDKQSILFSNISSICLIRSEIKTRKRQHASIQLDRPHNSGIPVFRLGLAYL